MSVKILLRTGQACHLSNALSGASQNSSYVQYCEGQVMVLTIWCITESQDRLVFWYATYYKVTEHTITHLICCRGHDSSVIWNIAESQERLVTYLVYYRGTSRNCYKSDMFSEAGHTCHLTYCRQSGQICYNILYFTQRQGTGWAYYLPDVLSGTRQTWHLIFAHVQEGQWQARSLLIKEDKTDLSLESSLCDWGKGCVYFHVFPEHLKETNFGSGHLVLCVLQSTVLSYIIYGISWFSQMVQNICCLLLSLLCTDTVHLTFYV